MREQLSITDFRGKEIGYLNVSTLLVFLFSLIRYVLSLQTLIWLIVGRSCAIKRQRKRDHWRWWHIYWWSQTACKSWPFFFCPVPSTCERFLRRPRFVQIDISYTKLWLVRIALSLHICCGWPYIFLGELHFCLCVLVMVCNAGFF